MFGIMLHQHHSRFFQKTSPFPEAVARCFCRLGEITLAITEVHTRELNDPVFIERGVVRRALAHHDEVGDFINARADSLVGITDKTGDG